MHQRTAIIIGAGPAGLTAAYELLDKSDVRPIVLEMSAHLGGISKTINYKGNRIDIGGHRFFSKSDRVMDWWLKMLPLEASAASEQLISYHNRTRAISGGATGPDPVHADRVMLVRERKSRIYFLRKFFAYPVKLDLNTLSQLGAVRTVRIGLSYLKSMAAPITPEANLEDFFINRFGRELYKTFFKSYTEKVWGAPCDQISADWGPQRVKGLSVGAAIAHFFKQLLPGQRHDLAQKEIETSLIEQFLYPKFGPGQMWEEVARQVVERGGEVRMRRQVVAIKREGQRVVAVEVLDRDTGAIETLAGDFFFSTMPVRELVRAMDGEIPENVREVAEGLRYRDFMSVGLLVNKLKINEAHPDGPRLIKDTWIYIQEADVQVGRLQIFNNWSPYMVADAEKVWLGLEYFCNEDEPLWNMSDAEIKALAVAELDKIGLIDRAEVLDSVVIRQHKAYPAYFGTYARFEEVRRFVDPISNLFLVGRNGMHRYNNQDHSMLTAMLAVEAIVAGSAEKGALWDVNTEEDYHEVSRAPASEAVEVTG
ncbi:MAG TPA: NAD(P)/FAD-dependent oxidoreductase [Oscillatoriaceae cyanobacterium]